LWAVRAGPCECRTVVDREHMAAQSGSRSGAATDDFTLAGGSRPARRALPDFLNSQRCGYCLLRRTITARGMWPHRCSSRMHVIRNTRLEKRANAPDTARIQAFQHLCSTGQVRSAGAPTLRNRKMKEVK
jgi:hypothetical protein